MMFARSTREEQIAAARAKFPVGAPVFYRLVMGEPEVVASKVCSEPWMLGHGEIVLKIEGRAGCVSVSHLQRLECGQ
jgi:hypothetical protein